MELSKMETSEGSVREELDLEEREGGSDIGCADDIEEMSHIVVVGTEKWRRRESKLKHRRKDREALEAKTSQKKECLDDR